MWVRVKPASSEREAQSGECTTTWNKRQIGGDDGLRLDILPRDSDDSENSEDSEDDDDDDDVEYQETCSVK